MGAAVVAGVDASPFFDFAEHILDPMALAMDCAVFAGNKSLVCGSAFNAGPPVIMG